MKTFPAQTLADPSVPVTPEEDVRVNHLAHKEAQWWALWPGEPGYGTPLHQYLGFTEQAWLDYAISSRRTR